MRGRTVFVVGISGAGHVMTPADRIAIDREAGKLGYLADLALLCNGKRDFLVTVHGSADRPGAKPRTLSIVWSADGMRGPGGKPLPLVDNPSRE